MATMAWGAPGNDILYYPWGQEWQQLGGMYNTHFAGMHAALQGSSLIDFTMYEATNRFYASNLGRWHSPDPIGEKAVRLDDPQTWNMYAYVRNNPTTLTDPSGEQAPDTGAGGNCRWGGGPCEALNNTVKLNAEQGEGRTAQPQSLSAAGLKFIEQQETVGGQPNLTVYDASGKEHLGDWTIGYGHKVKPGEDFSQGITADQAGGLLQADVQTAVNAVNSALRFPTSTQGQFDAMVSLAYNIGGRAFADSTLVQRWNGAGVVEQPDLFTRWSRTGGAFSPGLSARREEEYALFNTGQYP